MTKPKRSAKREVSVASAKTRMAKKKLHAQREKELEEEMTSVWEEREEDRERQ
jgi:hypothetical protein